MNNDQILLIKRSDNLEYFPGWYILPGGKHEYNETPLHRHLFPPISRLVKWSHRRS